MGMRQRAVILQHKNIEVCKQSTAGGAFTAIAEYVINNNGIVYGVELEENLDVKHISVEKNSELYKFRNSKYVQSKVGNTYREIKVQLENGRMVCFSGTPCQVEGLKSYLNKEYNNLISVDVVCRAVPSPGVWKRYIDMEQAKNGKIQSVKFRDKKLGYQYSTMVLKFQNGKEERGGIEDQPWLRMFFSGMIIRPSCTECHFRNPQRKSDFTIWDCFNSYYLDKKMDESKGVTRMLIHSKKGADIFEKIKDSFIYTEINTAVSIRGVSEMEKSPKPDIRKTEFYRELQELNMNVLVEKYFPITYKTRIKILLRKLLNKLGLDIYVKRCIKKF